MHQHIEDFLDDVEGSKAYGTYENRKSDLRQFERWLDSEDVAITEVTSKDIHRFLRGQGKQFSNSTVQGRYNSVKQFYDFLAGVWDVIDDSPLEDLKRSDYVSNGGGMKHQMADIVYITPEEKEKLVEHAPNPSLRNELLIRLLWQTGVRRGELVKIELDKIDREERAIEVWSPKTETWRTVYYQPSLDLLMDQWIDGGYRDTYLPASRSPYLFVTERAEHATPHLVNRIIRNAAENADIQEVMYEDGGGQERHRITAHAMRHGHAVHALKSGIDVRTVQKHLGHEQIETTMKYLRLVDGDVREGYKRFNAGAEE